jgi:hypothetical protein
MEWHGLAAAAFSARAPASARRPWDAGSGLRRTRRPAATAELAASIEEALTDVGSPMPPGMCTRRPSGRSTGRTSGASASTRSSSGSISFGNLHERALGDHERLDQLAMSLFDVIKSNRHLISRK